MGGFKSAAAQGAAPQGAAPKEVAWRVQSTWPAANLLHESPIIMAKAIDEMSGGRLKMNVAPAGTYVGAFEVLDSVHKNVMDAAHSWPGSSVRRRADPSAWDATSSSPGCTVVAAWSSTTSCCRRS
jgi:TRAP-type mannitol/chloroaromatic compound transport system substrate-binding protein